jgi:hypothetical protein
MTIAVTAFCNLRCAGCRYGRSFMPGAQLPLRLVQDALIDARASEAEVHLPAPGVIEIELPRRGRLRISGPIPCGGHGGAAGAGAAMIG